MAKVPLVDKALLSLSRDHDTEAAINVAMVFLGIRDAYLMDSGRITKVIADVQRLFGDRLKVATVGTSRSRVLYRSDDAATAALLSKGDDVSLGKALGFLCPPSAMKVPREQRTGLSVTCDVHCGEMGVLSMSLFTFVCRLWDKADSLHKAIGKLRKDLLPRARAELCGKTVWWDVGGKSKWKIVDFRLEYTINVR
jgi:hypothetical protein